MRGTRHLSVSARRTIDKDTFLNALQSQTFPQAHVLSAQSLWINRRLRTAAAQYYPPASSYPANCNLEKQNRFYPCAALTALYWKCA